MDTLNTFVIDDNCHVSLCFVETVSNCVAQSVLPSCAGPIGFHTHVGTTTPIKFVYLFIFLLFLLFGVLNAFYMLGKHSVAQLHLHPDDKSQIVNKV